jgi:hypothetical protein
MKICILIVCIIVLSCSVCFGENDISMLLQKGKDAIENGKYEDAVNRLGEIMTASGDQTNDPKIVAFGSTVQAYGIWKMNNPQMTPMVIQYLNKAITADSTWEYPQKLLKEIENKG